MAQQARQHKFICFSDIDGTLVHYLKTPAQLQEIDGELLFLPQSSTGKQGIISKASIVKCAELTKMGAAFVIVSGARTSTVLQRLPFLPAADAVLAENGGRIWYPDPEGQTMCPLQEDMEWRQQLSDVTGPLDQEMLPPLERQGPLWEWYGQLHEAGWKLDSNSYSTCFRLTRTPGKTEADIQAVIAARPSCLASTFNMGAADFYPATSGKEAAAAHLMQRFGVPAERTIFLCDDDNDLGLAGMVGKAFLPSISAASVEQAVAAQPDRFVVADLKWTGGTEQMLDAVKQHFTAMASTSQQKASKQPEAVPA